MCCSFSLLSLSPRHQLHLQRALLFPPRWNNSFLPFFLPPVLGRRGAKPIKTFFSFAGESFCRAIENRPALCIIGITVLGRRFLQYHTMNRIKLFPPPHRQTLKADTMCLVKHWHHLLAKTGKKERRIPLVRNEGKRKEEETAPYSVIVFLSDMSWGRNVLITTSWLDNSVV